MATSEGADAIHVCRIAVLRPAPITANSTKSQTFMGMLDAAWGCGRGGGRGGGEVNTMKGPPASSIEQLVQTFLLHCTQVMSMSPVHHCKHESMVHNVIGVCRQGLMDYTCCSVIKVYAD